MAYTILIDGLSASSSKGLLITAIVSLLLALGWDIHVALKISSESAMKLSRSMALEESIDRLPRSIDGLVNAIEKRDRGVEDSDDFAREGWEVVGERGD